MFCPIEKKKEGLFHADLTKIGGADCIHVARLDLMGAVEDYTFISYANDKSKPPPLAKSPVYRMIDQDCPKVAKYAVFILTSELHVGGGE